MRPFWLLSLLLVLPSLARPDATAPGCGLASGFDYLGVTVRSAEVGGPYVYVTDEKIVDADGAPNTYHPEDAKQGCPSEGHGLDCLASAGYPGEAWWKEVLVRDPDDPDRPYVQRSGPYQGFFVSKTSLRNPDYAGALSPLSYVDADAIPYLVLPAPILRTDGMGEMGDLGYAVDLDTGRATPFVIADEGPVEPLGEASVAFWRALGGQGPNPRNGAGLPPGRVVYIVFPGSGQEAQLDWPLRPAQIAQAARSRLDRFGGRERLLACAGGESEADAADASADAG